MKLILFTVLALFTFHLHAADYYWVGGGGNWSDLNHWHLGSTSGPNPSIVPSSADNVFFDVNSGFGTTVASRTITLNSNAFCTNMTWTNVPNAPIFSTSSASFSMEVWGNLVLSGTTTYGVSFNLRGGTANTLSSYGNILGTATFNINKPGGSLTVTDSLVCLSSVSVNITSGAFDIAGKRMSVFIFGCQGSNPRSVNFTNSNVTVGYQYIVTGANKTINAAGSTLNALGYLYADSTAYNKVFNNASDASNFSIYNCSFSTLTFVNSSLSSQARIHSGNTADTIRFMGSGSIGSDNNVNVIIAAGGVSTGHNNDINTLVGPGGVTIGSGNVVNRVISGGPGGMGGDNTVTYWQHGGHFNVSVADTNTIDTLLLTPGKIITFRGRFNINNYLQLNGTICDAFSEVSGDSLSGSLNFATGATAVMNNMILTGLKAFVPITPLAVNGIDNGGNQGFTITAPASSNTTLYWIGGAGDWNDRSHWSTTSGGAGGACVPYIGDDVVFDANSGFAAGNNTVTTSSSTFCRNMTWAVGVGTSIFNESGAYTFRIYGSLVMQSSVTFNAFVEFSGSDPASITTNGNTIGGLQFIIVKTNGATVTLTDNWNNPTGGSFVHRSGGLNLSGRTINLAYYTSIINATRSVDISNATLTFTQYWDFRLTGKSLVSIGSHITTPAMISDALAYPRVDVTGLGGTSVASTTFGQLLAVMLL